MNWPDDLDEIECVGFGAATLPALVEAWDNDYVNKHVDVIRHTSTDISWTFDYLSFRYRLDCEESTERLQSGAFIRVSTPYRLTKIARIGVENDGTITVIEEYPLLNSTPEPQQKAQYEQAWGSF